MERSWHRYPEIRLSGRCLSASDSCFLTYRGKRTEPTTRWGTAQREQRLLPTKRALPVAHTCRRDGPSSPLAAVLRLGRPPVGWDGEVCREVARPKGMRATETGTWVTDRAGPSRRQQARDAKGKGGETACVRRQSKIWKGSCRKTSSSCHGQKSLPETGHGDSSLPTAPRAPASLVSPRASALRVRSAARSASHAVPGHQRSARPQSSPGAGKVLGVSQPRGLAAAARSTSRHGKPRSSGRKKGEERRGRGRWGPEEKRWRRLRTPAPQGS